MKAEGHSCHSFRYLRAVYSAFDVAFSRFTPICTELNMYSDYPILYFYVILRSTS